MQFIIFDSSFQTTGSIRVFNTLLWGRIDNILINYPTGQRFRCPCPVKSGVDHVIVQQVFSKKAFTVCCFLAFISTHEIDFPDHSNPRHQVIELNGVNFYHHIDRRSEPFELEVGDNYLEYDADENYTNLDVNPPSINPLAFSGYWFLFVARLAKECHGK